METATDISDDAIFDVWPGRGRAAAAMNARRAALTLLGGSGMYAVLGLTRNLLLARLMSVADFGIAATFLITLSFLQGLTSLGLQKMQVQNKAGDDPDFVAAVKGVIVLRNLVLAAALVVAAGPVARLMGHDDLVWAYRLLALQPLMMTLLHPDVARLQRQMRFGLTVATQSLPVAVALVLIWPAFLIFGDFRMALAVLLAESAVGVLISHLLAERPFRARWNTAIAWHALRFGLPVLGATLLGFAAMQGDRVIVSNQFGAAALGLASATIMLVHPAVRQSGTTATTFLLPLLARVQTAPAAFRDRASVAMQGMLVSGLAIALLAAFVLPALITLIYGQKYADATVYTAVIGLALSLQHPILGINIVAIGRAHTGNQLITNAVRAAFLPVAFWLARQGQPMLAVLSVSVAAQVTGLAVGAVMVWWRTRAGNARDMALPYLFGAGVVACLMWEIWRQPAGVAGLGLPGALALALFAALLASCTALRREALAQLRKTRRQGV